MVRPLPRDIRDPPLTPQPHVAGKTICSASLHVSTQLPTIWRGWPLEIVPFCSGVRVSPAKLSAERHGAPNPLQ